MDDYLRGLSAFDPNGSLSKEDADRIWASYKAAGGGRDVSATLNGANRMDPTVFGALGGGNMGGLFGAISRQMNPTAAPQVPSDGAMQATIGPGAAPPAAPAYTPKLGLPKGGLLGILQGQSPQGIMGLLQSMRSPGSPLAGGMPAAGMLSGLPGTPGAAAYGPVAPPSPQLPMDINPMNQF